MSGACREGMDLLNMYGLRAFFRSLLRGRFNRYVWRDTFGRVLCWLSGEHTLNQHFENGEVETSCHVCCKWLKQDGYKWRVK